MTGQQGISTAKRKKDNQRICFTDVEIQGRKWLNYQQNSGRGFFPLPCTNYYWKEDQIRKSRWDKENKNATIAIYTYSY